MANNFWAQFPSIPDFDCMRMKRDIQASIYEETKDSSPAERVAYFNGAGERLRARGGKSPRDSELPRAGEEHERYNK